MWGTPKCNVRGHSRACSRFGAEQESLPAATHVRECERSRFGFVLTNPAAWPCKKRELAMSAPRRDPKRGTWYFVEDVPTPNGKRRQVKRTRVPTKKAAERAAASTRTWREHGTLVDPVEAHSWRVPDRAVASALAGRNLRPTTLDGYRQVSADVSRSSPRDGAVASARHRNRRSMC